MYRAKVKIFIILLTLTFIPFSSCANTPIQPNTQPTYDNQTIQYFTEISLGFEYGSAAKVIRKWERDIKIKVEGNPTIEDMITLFKVVNDLNRLIGGKVNIDFVNENEDYTTLVYFGDLSTFRQVNSNYVDGNLGFFSVQYNFDNELYSSIILISTDKPTQSQKNHLIREELVQSLGLFQDNYLYEYSIFQARWTETQEFSEIDEKLIEMLYLDEIKSGMSKVEVERVLNELNIK